MEYVTAYSILTTTTTTTTTISKSSCTKVRAATVVDVWIVISASISILTNPFWTLEIYGCECMWVAEKEQGLGMAKDGGHFTSTKWPTWCQYAWQRHQRWMRAQYPTTFGHHTNPRQPFTFETWRNNGFINWLIGWTLTFAAPLEHRYQHQSGSWCHLLGFC